MSGCGCKSSSNSNEVGNCEVEILKNGAVGAAIGASFGTVGGPLGMIFGAEVGAWIGRNVAKESEACRPDRCTCEV